MISVVSNLAKILKVNLDYLLDTNLPADNINLYNIPNIITNPKTKKVPLLGTVACGEPIFADEQYGEYIDCLDDISTDFCLKCKGDSMINARIYDGDIVYKKTTYCR